MNKKMNRAKKIAASLASAMMLLTMLLGFAAGKVFAEDENYAMRLGMAGIAAGDHLYFGDLKAKHYDDQNYFIFGDFHNEQFYWRVLEPDKDKNGARGATFMMTEYLISEGSQWAPLRLKKQTYLDSNLPEWYRVFAKNVLTPQELNAIRRDGYATYNTQAGTMVQTVDVQVLTENHKYRFEWPLVSTNSINDRDDYMAAPSLKQLLTYCPNDYYKPFKTGQIGWYATSSVTDSIDRTIGISGSEFMYELGIFVSTIYYNETYKHVFERETYWNFLQRPTTSIEHSQVMFNSAVGLRNELKEEYGVGPDALQPLRQMKKNEKLELTLIDPDRKFSAKARMKGEDTLEIYDITGAEPGEGEFISAMITKNVDGTQQLVYYGQLADCRNEVPETVSINHIFGKIPQHSTEYNLYIFSENYSGSAKTSYASQTQLIDLNNLNDQYYTVSFDMNGHGSPKPEPQKVKWHESAAEPEEPEAQGYEFLYWTTDKEGNNPYSWNHQVEESMTLYAQWKPLFYTIYYISDIDDKGEEYHCAEQDRTYDDGLALIKSENMPNLKPPSDDVVLTGWNTSPDGSGQFFEDGSRQNIMVPQKGATNVVRLYAQWSDRFEVRFKTLGYGETPEPELATVKSGWKIAEPKEPEAEGCSFGGWYADLTYSRRWDFDNDEVPGDMTLYAKWDGVPYTVRFDRNGGSGNMDDQQRNVADYGVLPECGFTSPEASKRFASWNTKADGSGTDYAPGYVGDLTTVKNDEVTLYAIWSEDFTVSFDLKGKGGPQPEDQKATEANGWKIRKPETPAAKGYTFGEWLMIAPSGDGARIWNFEEDEVTGNMTLTAYWKQNSYTVHFDANGGKGDMEDQKRWYDDNEKLADSSFTRDGYVFTEWNTRADGRGKSYKAGCTDNLASGEGEEVTLYAQWVQAYEIRFSANGGRYSDGETVHSRYTNADGQLDEFEFPPNSPPHSSFSGWYTSPSGGLEVKKGAVFASDTTLYAKWNPPSYASRKITLDPNGGSVDPETIYTDYLDEPLPVPVYDDHIFTGWYTDRTGGVKVETNGVNIQSDMTFYAHWEKDTRILPRVAFFDLNGHGSERPSAQIKGRKHRWKLDRPEPDPSEKGYTFTGWYKEADCINEWDFRADSLTELITRLYAGWRANSYTVRFDGNGGTGVMLPENREYDDGKALTDNAFKKEDHSGSPIVYTFTGWNTKRDGTGDAFANKDTRNITSEDGADITLFAQWNKAQIITNILPDGRRLLEYSVMLEQNGVKDAEWSIVSGELVEGLSLSSDGLISGTPQQAQTNCKIRVYLSGRDPDTDKPVGIAKDLTFSILEQEPLQVVFDVQEHGTAPDTAMATPPEWKVAEPSPAPSEAGYTFGGWYTDKDCTPGNEWDFGGKVTMDMVLYAKWTANEYTVKFDPGKGSGSMDDQSRVCGDGKALPACTFAPPAHSSVSVFTGWNTKADGSGEHFDDRSTKDVATEGKVTLYAQWSESRVAVFDLNGHGDKAPAPQMRGSMHDYKLTVPETEPSEPGYRFTGWYKEKDCKNKWDFDKDRLSKPLTILYAGWKPVAYTVKFEANPSSDGLTVEGSMEDQDRVFDDGKTLPRNAYSISDGEDPGRSFIFTGWNTKADGSGDGFGDEDAQNITDTAGEVTLYAMWNFVQITTSRLPRGTQGKAYSATLTQMGLTDASWEIKAGELPEGFSLDSATGVISGTSDQAGTFSFTVEVTGTDMMGDVTTLSKKLSIMIRQIDPEPLIIKFTEGMNGIWMKGDKNGLDFRTNGPFEMFVSLDVDGTPLVKDRDYTAKPGSTVIELRQAYLETLKEGSHILTAHYNDGQEPFTQFTVASKPDDDDRDKPKPDDEKVKPDPDKDDKMDTTPDKDGDETKPSGAKTGDEAHALLWALTFAMAMMLLAVQTIRLKRRKK